jgi:YggT family protein
MKAIYLLIYELLNIYKYIVIVNVIISWLVAFNVLNTHNRFVYSILELSYKLTEPMLNKIRRFLPNLGTLDISPVILLVLIWFLQTCMYLYLAPIIFN